MLHQPDLGLLAMASDPRGCRMCSRLVEYRHQQQTRYPEYFNRPVPGFGTREARLLIVGLAPGLHGANATGKPFTGDSSGKLLFETLQRTGFARQTGSGSGEQDLQLLACRITNAVKCVPPQNRPVAGEVNACNRYLRAEIAAMPAGSILLALGGVAHRAILLALGQRSAGLDFRHAAEYTLPGGLRLVDSYHPSRYNQNTGRLTAAMLARVFERIGSLLHG